MNRGKQENLAIGSVRTDWRAAPVTGMRTFSAQLRGCFGRRADALFELTDAILTAGSVPSPVHLSLAPAHRRSWCSLYAALSKGRIDAAAIIATSTLTRPIICPSYPYSPECVEGSFSELRL
jgi:hypothetical protein